MKTNMEIYITVTNNTIHRVKFALALANSNNLVLANTLERIFAHTFEARVINNQRFARAALLDGLCPLNSRLALQSFDDAIPLFLQSINLNHC